MFAYFALSTSIYSLKQAHGPHSSSETINRTNLIKSSILRTFCDLKPFGIILLNKPRKYKKTEVVKIFILNFFSK